MYVIFVGQGYAWKSTYKVTGKNIRFSAVSERAKLKKTCGNMEEKQT